MDRKDLKMNATTNEGLRSFEDLKMVQWSAADNKVLFDIKNEWKQRNI